ncbi:hypothetical protein WJX77_002293 [Trebouxia sp. C0004]
MKRLKSWGSSKSSAKAEAAAKAANQSSSGQWPTVSNVSEEQPAMQGSHQQAQRQAAPSDTYVNFSDDEIRAMEESALEYAIQQSQYQKNSAADGASDTVSHHSPEHSKQLHDQLPQASQAPQNKPQSEFQPQPMLSSQPTLHTQPAQQTQQGQPYSPFQANAQPLPEPKKKGMGKFKLGLGLKKQGSKTLSGADTNPNTGNPYPMASGGHHAGRLGSRDQVHPPAQPSQLASLSHPSESADYPVEQAAVAVAVAASELAAQESGRLSEHRSGQQQEEQAMLELAIKESEVQAEYDNILREAKLLRMDLQHALTKCLEHRVNVQQEHSELSELMGDFGLDNAKGKGVAADHAIEQQYAHSEHDLQQANERVTAVNAAIGELQNLEDFIRTTKPPREEAATLTEEIVRQLLERLNFLRLDFAVPEQALIQSHHSAPIVHRFREQQAKPSGPTTPTRPTQTPSQPPSIPSIKEAQEDQPEGSSSGAAYNPFEDEEAPGPSSANSDVNQHDLHEPQWTHHSQTSHAVRGEEQQSLPEHKQSHVQQEEVFTPVTTPRPEQMTTPQIATPAAVAPPFPPRSPSMNSVASPRLLNRFDSRSSTESANGNNVAMAQSKEQSRQLLEKASQKLASLLVNANDKNFDATRKPGDPAVRRAPQVVHLYQELRKMMGDDFMVRDMNSQDGRESMLHGMQPYQALTAADEQARQRRLAEDYNAVQAAKTDAEKHARLLNKLSAQISSAKLRSMEEVIPFVQDAQQQLSVLRADQGLTVSQFEAWPKQRLDVLGEAAGQFRELSYLQVKYQKWMLQQGTCLEEAARIEEFFDTARARVEWLTSRQEITERRFTNHGVPWDRSVFKATRHASLHLAVIFMSRILFEVANLERSTTLKNEECLLFLADAVRLGYKAHQFAGGFTVDSAELFGKVKRLTQYYMRSMDPTWLKDTTKFTISDRQRWDHVQRK